jgi:hypothetical protein
MITNSVRITMVIIFIVSISLASLHCGISTGARSGIIYDQRNSTEMFGCYHLVATVGGIQGGGIHEAEDERMHIVLTPDSLFNEYFSDTLYRSMKFAVSWKNEGIELRTASLVFDHGANPEHLSAVWRHDSLFVGTTEVFPDAGGSIFVKSCR